MTGRIVVFLLAVGLPTAGCSIPRWPVEGPLVSPFGIRFRGIRPDLHRGVDISVPDGTEIRSMSKGTVRFAGVMRGYGNVIWLDHRGEVLSVYAHLSSILVEEGEQVDGGQLIALSGRSGDAAGPHLHFEIWRRGRELDPVALLGGFPGGGL
jgi:murein DD-endopeptidase MepM/ murein hydrolase activator NlpD